MEWFLRLEKEEQEFIKVLLLHSGSLKETAKQYGVSYPTLRLRLDRLLEKIRLNERVKDPFESELMHMVVDEKLSFDVAKQILQKYKENKETKE